MPEREPHAELELYGDLGACLKIASAGVAVASHREREWRTRISPALDRLATAAQILDDLQDVEDDLADGRINYAAWSLSRPILGPSMEAIRAVAASNLATTDRLAALLEVPRRLLAEAEDLVGEACPPISGFLDAYRGGIAALESEIGAERSDLLDPSGRAA